jgi:hypothetical protein
VGVWRAKHTGNAHGKFVGQLDDLVDTNQLLNDESNLGVSDVGQRGGWPNSQP